MARPQSIGSEIRVRQRVDRSEVDDLLEQLGERIQDSQMLGKAMETAEYLLEDGWGRAARGYVKAMLADPSLLEEQTHRCVCGGNGWVFTDTASVKPCSQCNPAKAKRWDTEADKDFRLGPRNHLDHSRKSGDCGECRRIDGVGEAHDDANTWK